jgi:C4-dicarboxylate-specific signal transduction histidine kinase
MTDPFEEIPDSKLVELLEKQKKELVVRVLQKHEEARSEKIFSDKILANLSDLFLVTSKNFVLVKSNEELRALLDLSPDDFGRLRLKSIMDPEAYDLIRELLAAGDFKHFETELTAKGGRKIHVSLNGSTYTTESGRVLHMLIARDMSDIYTMMSHIKQAQEQLIHSGRLASLGEMAAGIGHELTQPLNAILLFARNSIHCLNEPTVNITLLKENLQVIIDRAKKASSIIKSLKSFARKETPKTNPVEINQILTNILQFLDSQLKLSDIEVELDLAPDIPQTLGHDVRLEQVFLNIIQNGIQSMGDVEEPHLTIKTFLANNIDPESFTEKEYIVTSIIDNGTGINPEVQGKIFDPFFTTREVGLGMGLGLSIVDRIVRSFSGFIRVESIPGQGSCFSVYLPAYRKIGESDAQSQP